MNAPHVATREREPPTEHRQAPVPRLVSANDEWLEGARCFYHASIARKMS